MNEPENFPQFKQEEVMKIKLIMMLVVLALLMNCGGAGIDGRAPKVYENAKAMVAEAKKGVEKMTIDEFNVKMESEDIFVVIDVREPGKYDEDNIPYSINIPRGLLEFKIADEKYWDAEGMFPPEKSDEIIVYCKKFSRGPLAVESLIKLGYTNVKYLYGGMTVYLHGADSLEEEDEPVEESGCG